MARRWKGRHARVPRSLANISTDKVEEGVFAGGTIAAVGVFRFILIRIL